jgi:hypothetical protein
MELTRKQCDVILESLRYSLNKIENYRYDEYSQKLASLKPIEETIEVVRNIKNHTK